MLGVERGSGHPLGMNDKYIAHATCTCVYVAVLVEARGLVAVNIS